MIQVNLIKTLSLGFTERDRVISLTVIMRLLTIDI